MHNRLVGVLAIAFGLVCTTSVQAQNHTNTNSGLLNSASTFKATSDGADTTSDTKPAAAANNAASSARAIPSSFGATNLTNGISKFFGGSSQNNGSGQSGNTGSAAGNANNSNTSRTSSPSKSGASSNLGTFGGSNLLSGISSAFGTSASSAASAASGAVSSASQNTNPLQTIGQNNSISAMNKAYGQRYPWVNQVYGQPYLNPTTGQPLPGTINFPSLVGPLITNYPPTPAPIVPSTAFQQNWTNQFFKATGGAPSSAFPSGVVLEQQQSVAAIMTAQSVQYPENVANQARATLTAQATMMGNTAGEGAKASAAGAIDFCSKFLRNFTVEPNNVWNQLRNNIFMPMAILLLLPGAVLAQVNAIVAAGSPVINNVKPFDGILRSIVAIFLIPGTYLVVNWGIDLSNSITYTISSEYQQLFGSDMYKDALCAEIRAFPVRTPTEDQGAGQAPTWPNGNVDDTTSLESNLIDNKQDDPCSGTYSTNPAKTDESMPASATGVRFAAFSTNYTLTATWNILCAFQVAYLYYLFLVGPVVAALWVWPIKMFRDALPAWIQGVITLCFWSLFWNTTILIIACFKGIDDTGTIYISALNFLATACVKFGFDFGMLVMNAGFQVGAMVQQQQQAQQQQQQPGQGQAQGQNPNQQAGPGVMDPSMNGMMASGGTPQPVPSEPTLGAGSGEGPGIQTASFTSSAGLLPALGHGFGPTGPVPVGLPPTATLAGFTGTAGASINSQTYQLGDYTLTSTAGEGGNSYTVQDLNGNVVAQFSDAALASSGSMPLTGDGSSAANLAWNRGSDGALRFSTDPTGSNWLKISSMHGVGAGFAGNGLQPGTPPVSLGTGDDNMIPVNAAGLSMFMSADGDSLYVPAANGGGGFDQYFLNGDGPTTLNIGGQQVTVNHGAHDGPGFSNTLQITDPRSQATESYGVSWNGSQAHVTHIDPSNPHAPFSSTLISNEGPDTVYRTMDPGGQQVQLAKVNADGIFTQYFDPGQNGALIGTSNTLYDETGALTTSYNGPDGTPVASTMCKMIGEGTFVDVLRDGQNNPISIQTKNVDPIDNSYSLSTDRFANGQRVSEQVLNYDPSGIMIGGTVTNFIDGRTTAVDSFTPSPNGGFSESMVRYDDAGAPFSQTSMTYGADGVLMSGNTTYARDSVMQQSITRDVDGSYTATFVDATGQVHVMAQMPQEFMESALSTKLPESDNFGSAASGTVTVNGGIVNAIGSSINDLTNGSVAAPAGQTVRTITPGATAHTVLNSLQNAVGSGTSSTLARPAGAGFSLQSLAGNLRSLGDGSCSIQAPLVLFARAESQSSMSTKAMAVPPVQNPWMMRHSMPMDDIAMPPREREKKSQQAPGPVPAWYAELIAIASLFDEGKIHEAHTALCSVAKSLDNCADIAYATALCNSYADMLRSKNQMQWCEYFRARLEYIRATASPRQQAVTEAQLETASV